MHVLKSCLKPLGKRYFSTFYSTATVSTEHVDIPGNLSLTDYLLSRVHLFPERKALIDGNTGISYTFAELETAVQRFGLAYRALGVNKNDVTCIMAPNSSHNVITFLGINSIGGIVTPINPTYTADEITRQLVDTQAKYLVTIPEMLPKLDQITQKYKGLQDVYTIGECKGFRSVGSLIKDDVNTPFSDVQIDSKKDTAFLPFSSGTTGRPKGVVLSHHNLIAAVASFGPAGRSLYQVGDVMIAVMPLFHIAGCATITLPAILSGCTVVYYPTFNFEEYIKAIEKYKATVITVVPSIFLRMIKDPLVERHDISSIHTAIFGAAVTGTAVITEFITKYPNIKEMKQVYGMTEASGGSHCTLTGDLEMVKKGSVGKALPNVQDKIIDMETGTDLGPNQPGELLIKSPSVMKGYLNRPDATQETFTKDGWLKTGDVARMDEDRYVYILDRIKEFIKYKAYQVSPTELEDVLLSHSAVKDVGVVGVADAEAGELPRAYVVLKPGYSTTEEELLKYMEEKVAPYKKLRGGLYFIDKIPKSNTGKILRKALKEIANAQR